MTKAKKQLSDLIENRPQDVALPSKNAVNLVPRAMPVRGQGWHWLWGN
jgi:hypothetical protein